MERKYDVDDILAELRQKRQQREGGAAPASRPPVQAARPAPPPAAEPQPPQHFTDIHEPPPQPKAAPVRQPLWGDDHDDDFDTIAPPPPKTAAAPPPKSAAAPPPPPAAEPAAPISPLSGGQVRGGFAEKWRAGMESFTPDEENPGLFGRRGRGRRAEDPPHHEPQPKEAPSPRHVWNDEGEEDGEDMALTRFDLPISQVTAGSAPAPAAPARRQPPPFPDDYDDEDDVDLEEEPLGEDEDIFEYTRPSQAGEVREELHSLRAGLLVRLLVTGLCSLVLVYLAFSYKYPLPLPPFMFPETHLGMYFIVSVGVLVTAVLVCSNTIGGGLISLFTLKADNDSLAAAAALACLIQGAALVVSPESYENPGVHLYLPLAALVLFFNTLGKLLITRRLFHGFGLLSKAQEHHTALLVTEKDLARELTRGQNLDYPQVAFSAKSGFLTNFLELAHGEDYSDSISRILAPVCLGAGFVMALVSLLFNRDIFVALTVFAAVMCVCSPFTALFVGNLPLSAMTKRLGKQGAMVSGYGAVERFGETNAVVLGCSELFPTGSITLHGIKVFQKNRIDEAIVDAASVICSCDSTLTGIFTEMIGGRVELLKKVESLTYEDGLGLSAWVGGKRVLIGSRELMKHHGIDTPSKDYEQRYIQGDRELLYLSNSGELTAMYILDYGCNPDVEQELGLLADRDISLVVYSTDPYVTPDRLEKIFDYPAELIKIMPAKLHGEYDRISARRESSRAYLAHDGSLSSFVHTLLELRLARGAVLMGTLVQTAAVVLGFALVTFAAFMQSTSSLTWTALLGYQAFWMLAVLTFPNLRRI